MRTRILVILLITILTVGFKSEQNVKILRTGEFHGDEVADHVTQMEWYGLINKSGKFVLQKIDVRVEKRHDPILDGPGDTSGIRVSTAGHYEPLILINGIPDLKAGEVETVNFEKFELDPEESMSVHFDNNEIIFMAEGILAEYGSVRSYKMRMRGLKNGRMIEQIIASTDGFDDAMYRFIWAGDIDRDGSLDLLMNISDHYNVSHYALFLSSQATDDQLVQKTAEFISVGC